MRLPQNSYTVSIGDLPMFDIVAHSDDDTMRKVANIVEDVESARHLPDDRTVTIEGPEKAKVGGDLTLGALRSHRFDPIPRPGIKGKRS